MCVFSEGGISWGGMVKRSAAMLNVTWRRRSACGEPDLTMPPGSLNTYEEVGRPSTESRRISPDRALVFRDRFVEIEHHVGNDGPGGQLGRFEPVGRRRLGLGNQRRGRFRIPGVVVELLPGKVHESIAFGGGGLPGGAKPESVRNSFFDVGAMSGNAKELAAAVELRDVHGMSVEKHKMTYSLTITFADNSARIFECVRMTKPQDIVDAFDKMKGTRAA